MAKMGGDRAATDTRHTAHGTRHVSCTWTANFFADVVVSMASDSTILGAVAAGDAGWLARWCELEPRLEEWALPLDVAAVGVPFGGGLRGDELIGFGSVT